MDKQLIRNAYKVYWLENGKAPVSVYALCKTLDISEADFYAVYSSPEAIEKDIWLAIFQDTLEQLHADEIYQQYNAQEKLLAFYFLWVQKLKEDRSYLLLQKASFRFPELHHRKLETFRLAFNKYVGELVKEGYQSNEIKERKYISDQYIHGFWIQALFVLKYWLDDNSANFEMTDAAIEKAVNLSFQLIRSNTLDSLLDFGKFIFTRNQAS
ncbi:TetR/AcrR family transcriptional regulator [Chitinophaga nivalis]|uniref:TetR family transcriptional regulator C-terminal domain-containing protein n=1 Tax=Chitinophaga nivalis TaxID=2991709 RepID=A0ABT3IGL5_9BACT|nr:TetR family transcriptional regulator C-terminal domain-containing protein [Chitinophaga nivalis]MCW3467257.1 TetR family transcriptional regulator C-terminal domain-containing protein [Chitinophaga nivalis]MCW3483051.1 TetR family transcriptional regulator C-terminal domain-containing protein [Chitinophaga nivalis]